MNRLNMQLLDDTSTREVEKSSYIHYASEQRETEAAENRQNMVRRLLAELPESERTVVTLYYLGKMTTKEISKFLGVSVNTIKRRLRRARKRLQEQETLVRETLGGVQLSDHLIENVMRHIADLNPTPAPPAKKPLLPWAAFGAAVVLVILFGVGSQYLLRFQQPYSFDAQSEPILIDIVAKPDVRNQIGRAIIPSKNRGPGVQISQTNLTANAGDDAARFSESRWTQAIGPEGGVVYDIFKAADGTIYAAAKTGLYKLTPDATWVLINADIPTGQYRVPMAEHQGTLYTVSVDEALTSEDGGETWNALGQRPRGTANGLIVTAAIQKHDPKAPVTLYLALQEKGIFRSTDVGQHWTPLNNGLAGKRVYTVAAIGDTLFAGTNQGLYRLGSSNWQRLLTDASGAVYALTVDRNHLYVGMGPDIVPSESTGLYPKSPFETEEKKVFHSADLGMSWTEITPTHESEVINLDAAIQILAVGKTLLVLGIDEFRSSDGGKTWTFLRSNISSYMAPRFRAVASDENTFCKVDALGIRRTTDAGASWHPFVNGMTGPLTHDLVALNSSLYMHIAGDLVQSSDGGETWESVRFNAQKHTPELDTDFYNNMRLTIADNLLYVISVQEGKPSIFRTSAAGNELTPIHGVPAFKNDDPSASRALRLSRIEVFAVGGGIFYAKYAGRLFKWKPGNPEWIDTGLAGIDTGLVGIDSGSALAVSGKTVYAGKSNGKLLHFFKGKALYASKPNGKVFKPRDAKTFYANKPKAQLFQSVDGGDSWKDITSTLPISIAYFKEITFAGSTICIATDKGTLISQTGEHWRIITNETAMPTVINRVTADSTTIYGVGDSGAYRLDAHDKWEPLASEVPSEIHSFVTNNDRLYVGTRDQGMFHISLEENN